MRPTCSIYPYSVLMTTPVPSHSKERSLRPYSANSVEEVFSGVRLSLEM
jgi:hypothetical protein